MGNMPCPDAQATNLVSIARDICPFPDYSFNPLFDQLLSVNSSSHLKDHYMAVQSGLTQEQLDAFTKGLRTTFGREGRVTLGGVGVVALSLAVLFDSLARQVKGQWVTESGPIPGLFHKEHGGYHPMVPVISQYLRAVPHIANNPTRMREMSEKYYRVLLDSKLDRDSKEKFTDVRAVNAIQTGWFTDDLRLHLIRLSSLPEVESIEKVVFKAKFGRLEGEVEVGNARDRRQGELRFHYSLNCDAEAASREFLAEVERSNKTKDEFENCRPKNTGLGHTMLHYIVSKALQNVINQPRFLADPYDEAKIAQREDFDLKKNTRGNWDI